MLVCVATLPMANAQTFARVDALTLNAGENDLYSAVIDVAGGFAYFGTDTVPGIVVKVRLSDFTRVGALPLNAGEEELYSAVIDVAGGFAYFGTDTDPGIVVKIGVGAPPPPALPPPAPVGGVLSPVDKLAIVAPYLTLLGLVGVVLAVAVAKRKPKN